MTTELRNQSDVFALPVPKEGEKAYFDVGKPKDRVQGLALRIRAGGTRRWTFFYRHAGLLCKLTLGDATALPIVEARKQARLARVKVDSGENPKDEQEAKREESKLTLSFVINDYLAARSKDLRGRSLNESTRHLRVDWKPLHRLPVAKIGRATVAANLRQIASECGDVACNRARSTLSAMFAWAIGEGLCEVNPVVGTNKQAEEPRDRVLSDAELVAIWNAVGDTSYGRIVRLLMLTGCRRDEMGALRWAEIDKDNAQIALPKERTKNARPHDVPLSDMALQVLDGQHAFTGGEFVFGENGKNGFGGWAKAKARLDEVCGVKGWVIHDLRRSVATRMADIGVQPHIIEAVLNHVSGHKAGPAGIYNRSTYAKEKREALNLWAAHLKTEIAKATGANVTTLKRKAKQ
jgi:integrase